MSLNPQRQAYVHLVRGDLAVNGQMLTTGDAAMLDGENPVSLTNGKNAEVLVFDLAA